MDSGADTLLIPAQIAEALGLEKRDEHISGGVFGRGKCYRTRVGFVIGRTNADKIDLGTIDAVISAEKSDIPILIGRDPLFKFFEITFMEYKDRPAIRIAQKKSL